MKPAAILYELQELRDTWRKQSFSYTVEQQGKELQAPNIGSDKVDPTWQG